MNKAGAKLIGPFQTVDSSCIRVAHSLQIVRCADPECKQPHLVLFDEDGVSFGMTVLIPEVIDELRKWGG